VRTSRPLRRGQIWLVDWEPHRGSEQAGTRPSLIVQSDEANELEHYNNTIVAAITTAPLQDGMVHIAVEPSRLNGLSRTGIVKCDQILTVSRARLIGYVGQVEPRILQRVDQALRDVLSI
jgi:mRNA interferase MazF